MRLSIIFTLVAFGFVACESTVEVEIPRSNAEPVLNAFFNPDSVWSVELSKNRYILDNNRFEGLPEAVVEIWQGDQLVTELPYQRYDALKGQSIYRAANAYPEAGSFYTIRVEHPDYSTLVASSQVPSPPQIISASLDVLDVRQDPSLSSNKVAYGLTLRLDDPPENNFYSLSLILRYEQFGAIDINGNDSLLLKETDLLVSIQSDNPVVDNVFGNYRDELLFRDVSFNGQQYEMKIYGAFEVDDPRYLQLFGEGAALNENAYDKEGNIVRQAGDIVGLNTLNVILRNTTEEYYNYNYTRDLQASVENNPFAQPVQVFDNIEGGLGVFAGYNQVEKQVTFR